MILKDNLNFKGIEVDFSPPNGIEEFYGKYVKGVCCIIGKNGSGKSNILEQIGKQILEENQNLISNNQTSVIYYAPIINNRRFESHNWKNFNDISEKHNFDRYQYMLNFRNTAFGNNQKIENTTQKDMNYIPLILWTLKYLSNNNNQKHQSELLSQINIEIENRDEYSHMIFDFVINSLKSKIAKNWEFLNDTMPKFYPGKDKHSLHDDILLLEFKEQILDNFFLFAFNEIHKFFLYSLFENSKIDDLFNKFLKEFSQYFTESKEKPSFDSINKYIEEFIDGEIRTRSGFFYLKKLLVAKDIQNIHEIGDDKNGVLIEFLEFYIKQYSSGESELLYLKVFSKENTIFNFSSGDTAYYTFLGRVILAIKDQLNKGNTKILLLLDEVDIALHPARQKALFKTITDSINEICSAYYGKQKIEIKLVLTTHSPFLASDIPSQNIVYLKVDEVINDKGEKEIITTQNNDAGNSFASNIHMLYKDSFYLNSGLIGDFAVEKIEKEIIPYLKGDQKNVDTSILMDHIKLIGDPILHEKMLEEYIKKYRPENGSKKEIEKLIEFLQSKLNK